MVPRRSIESAFRQRKRVQYYQAKNACIIADDGGAGQFNSDNEFAVVRAVAALPYSGHSAHGQR